MIINSSSYTKTEIRVSLEPWSCGFLDGSSRGYKMDRDEYSKIRNSISWNDSCDTIQASDIVLSKYGSTWASLLLEQPQVYLVSMQVFFQDFQSNKME